MIWQVSLIWAVLGLIFTGVSIYSLVKQIKEKRNKSKEF